MLDYIRKPEVVSICFEKHRCWVFNSYGIQVLVIPFKGWSNRGWCFTSSSQLYSLEATTRPCLRCVGKDGRGGCSGEGRSPVLQEEQANVFRVCCLALWRKGAGMGNPAGYQEGLLICSVTGTFFPPSSLLCWGNHVSWLPLFRDLLSAGVSGSFLSSLTSWHSELSVLSADEHTSQTTFSFFNYSFIFLAQS